MKELKSINEVCKMLNLTSRTIRYYEQCGLIATIRDSRTAPRRLDDENIERLRKIRFLRRLGLTLDEIGEVSGSEKKAAELIYSKNAELQAEIRSMMERVGMLEQVLMIAEQGGNIYDAEPQPEQSFDEAESLRIAAECTRLIREGSFTQLQSYLCSDMRRLPPEFFASAWNVHLKPCGEFVSVGEQIMDGHTVVSRLYYEKLNVAIRIDVFGGIVVGLVLQHFKGSTNQ